MTKRTGTKHSLILSALSLLLCISMLIGTTFAWFTDSVSSNNNIIKSGNLDVELEYATKIENGKVKEWTTVHGADKVFDPNALWEPGRVEVAYLKVSNLGSLALKYQLGVNVVNEIAGVNVEGNELKLSEHLVFTVVELADDFTAYSDRQAATLAAGQSLGLKDYNGTTKALDPKDGTNDEDYVALIVYMPESVGNEANYRGTQVPTIELGINLFATQWTAEIDSFDELYDKNAWAKEFKVTNANDLQAAINAGETNISLENDIETDTPIVIPAAASAFAMRSTPAGITINLNGKTLKNNNDYVIENQGNLTIGNGTISGLGGIRSKAGSVTIEDLNLYASSRWQDGTYQHSLKAENSVIVINSGNFDATVNGQTNAMFNASGNGIITINGGTFKNVAGELGSFDPYIFTYEKNGKLVINGGSFHGGWRFNGETATTDINGGSFSVGFDGQSFNASSTHKLTVYGGTFVAGTPLAGKLDSVMAEGYAAVDNNDGTYTVKFPQESFDSLIDGAGAGDTVQIPAGTFTFPSSKLQAGMTLECAEGTVFTGNSKLNIKGATVVGATFSNPGGTAVDQTINGTFKDCTFTGSNALRWCYAGETVVFENCVFEGSVYGVHFDGGENNVVFRNCTFSGFNAMAGSIPMATFEGCTFVDGKANYNGINLWGSATMTDCTFIFDGKAAYEWIDLCGDNTTATFNNCVVTDGEKETPIEQVVGDYGKGNVMYFNSVVAVSNNDMLKKVIADGKTEIILLNGEYDLNGIQKDGLKLIGAGNSVKVANTTKYASGKSIGAIWKAITLENVTLTNTVYTMADGGDATFKNVNFSAGFRQGYGKNVTFEACTFGSNSEGYALHFQTDSSSEGGLITLNGCTFQGGKVHLGGKRAYAFTDCKFAEGTDFQVWSGVTLENGTVNGEKVTAANVSTLFPALNVEKVTLK